MELAMMMVCSATLGLGYSYVSTCLLLITLMSDGLLFQFAGKFIIIIIITRLCIITTNKESYSSIHLSYAMSSVLHLIMACFLGTNKYTILMIDALVSYTFCILLMILPYMFDKHDTKPSKFELKTQYYNGELGNKCGICLDVFNKKSIVYDIPCKHYYHKTCLNKWIKSTKNCPSCRHYIY